MPIRNPLKHRLQINAPVWLSVAGLVNAPAPTLTQGYIGRVQTRRFTTTTTPGGRDHVWWEKPLDANCRFTEESVLIGRNPGAAEPFCYLSFAASRVQAIEDVALLLVSLRSQQAQPHPAVRLNDQIRELFNENLPILDDNGPMHRKERATILRAFFHERGIHGFSVTSPNYARATCVRIELAHCDRFSAPADVRNQLHVRLQQLLDKLFPGNVNRSEQYADYFANFAWSITV